MELSTDYDVVVIGSGIQGAFAALALADRGITDVAVLEATGSIGGLSTTRSASMLTRLTMFEELAELADRSLRLYHEFEHRLSPLGPEYRGIFHWTGFAIVAEQPANRADLETHASFLRDMGVDVTLASAAELIDASSGFLRLDPRAIGCVCEADGYAELGGLTHGVRLLAHQAGVVTTSSARVTDIEVDGDGVAGVGLEDGRHIRCRNVVNAAGIGAGLVATLVGRDLRITPSLKNLVMAHGLRLSGPIIERLDDSYYYRQDVNAILVGVGKGEDMSVEEALDNPTPELDPVALERCREHLLAHTAATATQLDRISAGDGWAGYRPLPGWGDIAEVARAPRVLPFFGKPLGAPDGYFESCGWGEFGITLGPVSGVLVADAIEAQGRFRT